MGVSEPGNLDSTPPEPRGSDSINFIESDRDSAPFTPEMSSKKTVSESKALVSVPSMVPDALAVVPFQKSKRSESSQRRIRRPFSVSEVEALVHAVEKLGTGRYVWCNLGLIMRRKNRRLFLIFITNVVLYCRWRDVKLRAFDNAKHRTYVDLKVKENAVPFSCHYTYNRIPVFLCYALYNLVYVIVLFISSCYIIFY